MTLTQTGAQADPTQCGTEVVLLVDDERAVRAVAGDMLRSFGYTVLEARGAEDAVQAATAHRGRIHLLLTDIALPRECGRALAAVMMACRPGLRILYMSGFSAAAVAPAAMEPGNFLAKPFTAAELAAKVRRVLDAG